MCFGLQRPAKKLDDALTEVPELTFIIDGAERPIARLKDNQRRYYRGKKKQHTVKNNLITDRVGRVWIDK